MWWRRKAEDMSCPIEAPTMYRDFANHYPKERSWYMKVIKDLQKALKGIPSDRMIYANHGTTELYVADETGRPRKFFSFIEPEEHRENTV
jgi:hypothetical protein